MLVRGRNVNKFFHRTPAETPGTPDRFRLKTDEDVAAVRSCGIVCVDVLCALRVCVLFAMRFILLLWCDCC